jgi:hypothetical protein
MEAQSSHGNPAYRCRHGHTSAHPPGMRQTCRGKSRREAIRCLKRYVARELYPLLQAAGTPTDPAATPA